MKMMKMADSATMRQAMPTMPREGSTQAAFVVCGMTAASLNGMLLSIRSGCRGRRDA